MKKSILFFMFTCLLVNCSTNSQDEPEVINARRTITSDSIPDEETLSVSFTVVDTAMQDSVSIDISK